MDASPGRAARAASSWNLSSSPRRHLYYPFSVNPSDSPATAAEASNSPRSPTTPSRRRRVLGRLVRSGSDPRATPTWSLHPEAPEFVPEAATKTPSKRKAPNLPKASKSVQRRSSMDHASPSNTDPPLIRSEDVQSSNQPAVYARPSFIARTFLDSSDDDFDDLDLALQTINPRRALGQDLRSRIRLADEARHRQDATRMLSAVLVAPDSFTQDLTLAHPAATEQLRYLPLCPSNMTMSRSESGNSSLLTVLPSHCNFVQRLQRTEEHSSAVWPTGILPVELFDLITTHLARDDVKAMRLVNREFEQKVSRSLFHTAVVPFNTEIYDMIDEDSRSNNRSPPSIGRPKGKLRALSHNLDEHGPLLESGGLQWENAKEDKEGKVYRGHGLRVFRGFGPHIKRFGMSFEISEKQLSRPPIKKELDHIESYHGSYDWPSENYARFATLAGLENTADETSRMKAAFSNLEIVQELALSIDSGLGWLNGPDKSLRATIFDQPTPVFGSSYNVPDHATDAANEFWTALQQSQTAFDPHSNLTEITLEYRPSLTAPTEIDGLRDTIYSNTQLWSTVDSTRVTSLLTNHFAGVGLFYTVTGQQRTDEGSQKFALMPGCLSKEQREWLLETQWAQQAFLESYRLAVIDNPSTFSNVTTLNLANVSSRSLPVLAQEAFWNSLPKLSEVIIRVNADWRTVGKDDAGIAQTTAINPSDAMCSFHRDILQERIAPRESIKKLTIGWFGGGEHAEGMFARNNNILPAPITRVDHCTANSTIFGMVFNHVEHLTLSNCWITPPALEGLVKSHSNKALKKLTLDSVSLTAHPKFPANVQGHGLLGAPQVLGPHPGQFQLPPPANPQQVAQFQLPPNANAQQVAQFQQHMMQQWQQQVQQQAQQLQQMQQQVQHIQQGAQQNQPLFNNPAIGNPVPPHFAGAFVGAVLQNVAVPNTANHQPNSHWTAGHREGSWPEILDLISPGTVFNDYLPAPPPWEEPIPPRPETNLRTIEFQSCGYAKLTHHTGFDQLGIEPTTLSRFHTSAWFRLRHTNLKAAMMSTADRNLGQIVQYMPQRELDALQFAWGLREGWEDREKASEAEFDGFAPGGTGRFFGVVEKGMGLVRQPNAVVSSSLADGGN